MSPNQSSEAWGRLYAAFHRQPIYVRDKRGWSLAAIERACVSTVVEVWSVRLDDRIHPHLRIALDGWQMFEPAQ